MGRSQDKNKTKKKKHQITMFAGHKLRVPNHPPEIEVQPWYHLVVAFPSGNYTNVTMGDVYSRLTAQSGITVSGTAIFALRIRSTRVWGPIPVNPSLLRVVFRDIFDDSIGTVANTPGVLDVIGNYGDAVNRARVGYQYSTAQQQKAVLASSGAIDSFINITTTGDTTIYVDLLWRPYTVLTLASNQDVSAPCVASNDGFVWV